MKPEDKSLHERRPAVSSDCYTCVISFCIYISHATSHRRQLQLITS